MQDNTQPYMTSISIVDYLKTAEENFRSVLAAVDLKLNALQISVLEAAGKIDFHLKDTTVHLTQIAALDRETRDQARQIRELQAQLKLAEIELEAAYIVARAANEKENNNG